MYTPQKSNHLRSHLRAIMALNHRRLIRPGKKMRPNFMRSTSLLYKILPTNLGVCKPTFYTIYTSHLRWNSTMRYCFYHTDFVQYAVFHILQYKLPSFNIQDDRNVRGLLAKPLKNSKITPDTTSRFSLLQCRVWSSFWMNINRVVLSMYTEIRARAGLYEKDVPR